MLGKAIKNIIEQEKAMKRKGGGLQLKIYIHTPKPPKLLRKMLQNGPEIIEKL